jgi:hypothetical protein
MKDESTLGVASFLMVAISASFITSWKIKILGLCDASSSLMGERMKYGLLRVVRRHLSLEISMSLMETSPRHSISYNSRSGAESSVERLCFWEAFSATVKV